MRLAVPDLVSNSYFPAIAAVQLGYLRDEGIQATCELRFPVRDAAAALREGAIDLLAGSAHAPVYVDPDWTDLRVLATLARNTYWFLVLRCDLDVDRERLESLRGVRIGAAPGPDLCLRRLFEMEGIDTASAGISIVSPPPPPPVQPDAATPPSFGVSAADALERGLIDGFWANGMGAEVAIRRGVGRVVVDARRDSSPLSSLTFPALLASQRLIDQQPEAAAAAVRAIARAQRELRRSPYLAAQVGHALFPPTEAALIADLVARDAPYYDAAVGEEAVMAMTEFARACGLGTRTPDYDTVVPAEIRAFWGD